MKWRSEQLRRDAEKAAGVKSTADPPCIDHSEIFTKGRIRKGTHYMMLGVWPDADEADIRRAFHRLSKKWHPDKNPDSIAEAESVFKTVKLAYETLSDADKRRKYDRSLMR